MPALITALIPLIPSIVKFGAAGIAFIQSLRTSAQQSAAWTPEAETAFLDSLLAYGNANAWKTDSELK